MKEIKVKVAYWCFVGGRYDGDRTSFPTFGKTILVNLKSKRLTKRLRCIFQ